MSKPTSKPEWTVGNPSFATVTVEPSSGKKQNGWAVAERPPFQFMNWLFWNINDWINYFEDVTDSLTALQGIYDAVVGTGGTHTTFNDLVADPDWIAGSIKNVLVVSTLAFDAPITLDQDDVNISCKPGVNIVGTASANRAFIVTGDRVRIFQCRFQNFNQGSDIAIELNGCSYPMILENYFLNNDATVVNTISTDPLVAHNIEEA